jgi:hypothetical protein
MFQDYVYIVLNLYANVNKTVREWHFFNFPVGFFAQFSCKENIYLLKISRLRKLQNYF